MRMLEFLKYSSAFFIVFLFPGSFWFGFASFHIRCFFSKCVVILGCPLIFVIWILKSKAWGGVESGPVLLGRPILDFRVLYYLLYHGSVGGWLPVALPGS